MSRPQWRLLFQGGLGYTFDGMDAALVAFILPSATQVFSLSSGQTGLLGSSVLIGYLFGALSAGILGDLSWDPRGSPWPRAPTLLRHHHM